MENSSHKFDGLLCRVVATEEQLSEIGIDRDIIVPFPQSGIATFEAMNEDEPLYRWNDYIIDESFLQPLQLAEGEEEKGMSWEEIEKEYSAGKSLVDLENARVDSIFEWLNSRYCPPLKIK